MGLKVLSITEWLISHILIVGGLVLVTIGLLKGVRVLHIAGMWVFAVGICSGLWSAFKKLVTK